MRTYTIFLLFAICLILLCPMTATADDMHVRVLKNGVSLHEQPDADSQVMVKAGEGWILHVSDKGVQTDSTGTQWYGIWEIDDEPDGEVSYWYVHHAFQKDAVYVLASDVAPLDGSSAPSPAPVAVAKTTPSSSAKAPAAVSDDDKLFMEGQSQSGTNRLGKAGLDQILSCLQKQPESMQWVKDVFFYQGGVDCFDLIGPGKHSFYNLPIIERTIGLNLDIREGVTPESVNGQFFLNPLIGHWVVENFTGVQAAFPDLFAKGQSIYEKNKHIARSFVYSYIYLTRYDNFDKQVQAYKKAASEDQDMLEYLRQFMPAPEQAYDTAQYDFDISFADAGYPDGYSRFRFAVGFWLRRGIDGSAQSFKSAMDALMQEYDADWYAQQTAKQPAKQPEKQPAKQPEKQPEKQSGKQPGKKPGLEKWFQ